MLPGSSVVMVSGGGGVHHALRNVLDEAGLHVRLIGSCAEARNTLKNLRVPTFLFTDIALPDGTWEDVLPFATRGQLHVAVISVSRIDDIDFHVNALEKGASDFVVPPFFQQDISYVLKCATQNFLRVRESCIPKVAAA